MRLIVTEKDNSARRIAQILSKGSMSTDKSHGIPFYSFDSKDDAVRVIGLKGHILAVAFPDKYKDWKSIDPIDLVDAEIIKVPLLKSVVKAVKKQAKDASDVIIATDFDREGELIGVDAMNIIREENSNVLVTRARFSSLTDKEIMQAFDKLDKPYISLAEAGEARQDIDLIWGASLTRVLSLATGRLGNRFLSVGRVQSPTLVLLSEKEKERQEFIPIAYWQVVVTYSKDKDEFDAIHRTERFLDKKEAEKVVEIIEETGTVESVERKERNLYPPSPFSTTMFIAAASSLGFSAANAMRIAEGLYMKGFISYPRTDNTHYPPSLDIPGLLKMLSGSEQFAGNCSELLGRSSIIPSHGKRKTTDHPPIYPTGLARKEELDDREWKLYELVVRRFLGTCADNARIESMKVLTDINGEGFISRGERILNEGWLKYYYYAKRKETILPPLSEGDILNIEHHELLAKATQPPSRYKQGSLIQEMEKLGLGTKATRHSIIQGLYDRGYIYGNPIVITKMGMAVAEGLKTHASAIASPKMTAELEMEMDKIADAKQERGIVVDKSRKVLAGTIKEMQQKKEELAQGIWKGIEDDRILGECPNCGQNLRIIRSKKTKKRFIGCSGYPDCSTTFPLPQYGMIQPIGELCKSCNSPKIKVITKGRKPWIICPDPKCPSKEDESKNKSKSKK